MNKPVHQAFAKSPADDQLLEALGLVDAIEEQAFDNLTSLAARVLGVPTALITIVQPSKDRQYFKSQLGLPAELAEARQTPLSHSFCQHVRASGAPLVVTDSRAHPILKYNGATIDLNLTAYLGVPIHLPNGDPIGALCAIDCTARSWTKEQQQTLAQIARCVDDQIALKVAIADAEKAEAAAQEAAQARETFLAHMAHEIRTPLNGIIGSVDLLSAYTADKDKDTRCEELLGSLETSSMGLLRILNDALDLSKIDAGELTLEQIRFSPCNVAKSVMSLFKGSAEAKSVTLTCACLSPGSNTMRLGDEFRFRQILSNLVSNAIKFTESGTVRLAMGVSETGLHLTVADSGIGMDNAQLARVFQPYKQAAASVARTKGGTGLGLAIVKSLVDLMGGEISVKSTLGEGTEFSLFFPMPEASPEETDHVSTEELHSAFEGKTVLVADDSSVNRLVLSKMLETMGATVTITDSGTKALQHAREGRFDLLFIDIQMPDFTGDQIAQALRSDMSFNDTSHQAALVAVTANVFPAQVQSYLNAGFDRVLAKPLKRVDLLDLVKNHPNTLH
jgi:signal transduction histidine kinase/ActR/RegA family two-component response regulator